MKNKKIQTASYIIITLLISLIFASKNSYAEHTLSLSTSSIQEIEVSPSGDGVTIREAELNVTTTCHAGYHLSLSTTVNDNNLYLDGSANNNSPGSYFSPSDGINSLISSNNTWGFYFSDSNEVPTKNSIFRPVPTLDNSITLRTPAQTASSSLINDNLSIYYGVKVATNTLAGQYKMTEDENHNSGTIVYYATLPEDCFQYTVVYDPTGTNLGIPVTGTGEVPNQTISEGVTANLTTEVYGNPTQDGTTYYFIGWNTAQDGSGTQYQSGQPVTDLASAENFVTLYAQWSDCPSEHICYYQNNSDAKGTMGQQPVSSNSNVTLLASNYSLPNYGFLGWSTDKNAATKFSNHEAVTIYGPNETILTSDLSVYGMHLYAVWLEANETFQEWNGCGNLEIGDVIALQDARDENAYAVAKLADNQCWMIENLRLESEDSTEEKSLFSQGYDSSFAGLADAENTNFSDSAVSNSLYSTNGSTTNIVSGDNIGSRFPRYNNKNTALRAKKPSDGDSNFYNYGNYYTWTAAIANTATSFDTNTVVDATSICPTNWRLPRGGNKSIEANNDFWSLIVNGINDGIKPNNYDNFTRPYYYGDTEGASIVEALKRFPNNFVQSGYYSGSSDVNKSFIGRYWSSVASVNNGTYLLNIETNRVDPGTSFYPKYYGHSIRCLFSSN